MMPDRYTKLGHALDRVVVADFSLSRAYNEKSEIGALRAKWDAIADYMEILILDEYGDYHHDRTGGLPEPIAIALWHLVGVLATGREPAIVQALKRKGAPRPHPLEKRDIQKATLYVNACKAGIIQDRTHTKTVAEAFEVSASTVRGWVRKFPVDAANWRPELEDQRAELIRSYMTKAGQHYRKHGRSPAAISRRDQKNNPSSK